MRATTSHGLAVSLADANGAPLTPDLLPIALVVSVVGVGLLIWFLLRGYVDK